MDHSSTSGWGAWIITETLAMKFSCCFVADLFHSGTYEFVAFESIGFYIGAFVFHSQRIIMGTAVGMGKYRYFGKDIIDYLLYIPVVIPEVVLGIALLCVFSICQIPLGLFSITIAHATFCIPFVVFTVRARLAGFDGFLEEAAMDLGANRFQTFMKVTFPLLLPGVISGALLAFSLSLDDVIISFFVSGPNSITLPVKIFSMVKTGVTPEVNALSTIIMLVVMVAISLNTGAQVKKLKKKTF